MEEDVGVGVGVGVDVDVDTTYEGRGVVTGLNGGAGWSTLQAACRPMLWRCGGGWGCGSREQAVR